MSHLSGNAWAIKARERERQLQEGKLHAQDLEPFPPLPETVLRPGSSRKSSGLDYDQELALPMPKPRHLPLPETDGPDKKASVLGRGIITKKRSTTEPPRPVEIVDALKAEERDKDKDKENKKSKIAALKSKFSLKDLGKDFRKDSHALPPLSSMPSMPVHKDTFAAEERLPVSAGDHVNDRGHSHKSMPPRQHGLHPLSAPPFQTTSPFPPHNGTNIKAPVDLETNIHTANKGKNPVRDASYFDESPILGKAEPMQHVHTVLIDGSSPLARTGEYANAGHAELVHNDQRISSMQADDHHDPTNTPVSLSSPSAVSIPVSVTLSNSSGNDVKPPVPVVEKKHPLVTSSQQGSGSSKTESEKKYPFIVSSDQVKHNTPRSSDYRAYPEPHSQYSFASSNFNPLQNVLYDTQYSYNNGVYDPYSGMTGHGGYAPPPPQQGYQNTMTLQQQVTSQVDAIHHHLDTALDRISRAIESNANWSSDQIIKNVESTFDTLRMWDLRQTEAIKEMNHVLVDMRAQLGGIVHRNHQLEDRFLTLLHTEMAKVRADISALGSRMGLPPYHAHPNPHPNPHFMQYPGMFFGSAGFPGYPVGMDPFGNRGVDRRVNYKKPRKVMRDGEVENGKKVDNEHKGGEDKEKDVSAANGGEGEGLLCATGLIKRAEPVQTSVVPPATTTFTVSAKDDVFTQSVHSRTIMKNPGRISSGSPEPKSSALKTTVTVTGNGACKSRKHDSEDKSSTDSGKNAPKRGIWNMHRRKDDSNGNKNNTGKNRTPGSRFTRRPRNNTNSSDSTKTAGEKKQLPSPQGSSAPNTPQSHESCLQVDDSVEESPSSIHPALRNPRQQQIMAERAAAGNVNAGITFGTVTAANTQNVTMAPDHRQEMRRPVIQASLPTNAPCHYPGVPYSTEPTTLIPTSMTLPKVYQAPPKATQTHSQMPSPMRVSELSEACHPFPAYPTSAKAFYGGKIPSTVPSGTDIPPGLTIPIVLGKDNRPIPEGCPLPQPAPSVDPPVVLGKDCLPIPEIPPVPLYAPPPVPKVAPKNGGKANVPAKQKSQG